MEMEVEEEMTLNVTTVARRVTLQVIVLIRTMMRKKQQPKGLWHWQPEPKKKRKKKLSSSSNNLLQVRV